VCITNKRSMHGMNPVHTPSVRDSEHHESRLYFRLRNATANNEMSHLFEKHAEFLSDAIYQGRLYKIDTYPGAVPSDNSNDVVHGEVYKLHQTDVALALLDQYEEFGPEFPEPNEYSRLKQSVALRSGRTVMAWIYVYNRHTEILDLIKSANFIQQPL